jgi:hypothetical protein
MFSKKSIVFLLVVSVSLLSLSACAKPTPTVDPSLQITEIAATVKAELTQIAALTPSATSTLTPTITATVAETTPTPSFTSTATLAFAPITGDNAKLAADITPDGQIIKPGASFVKTWSFLNNGTTTWTKDYQLMFIDGSQPVDLFVKLGKEVAPGETIEITAKFVAPTANGSYLSWWQMYSADGFRFGEQVFVSFSVGTDTATPTSSTPSSTPTATNTPTP